MAKGVLCVRVLFCVVEARPYTPFAFAFTSQPVI